MKTAVLISIVAASRQARDTQLLFDKMMDNNNVKEKTFFSETDSVLDHHVILTAYDVIEK